MNIVSITVSAGRTFNHPYEQYSNLRPEVSMTAELNGSDDPDGVTKLLQAKAEGLVEDHKRGLLASIEELHKLSEYQAAVRGLQDQLKRTQQQLDHIRSENPQLQLE